MKPSTVWTYRPHSFAAGCFVLIRPGGLDDFRREVGTLRAEEVVKSIVESLNSVEKLTRMRESLVDIRNNLEASSTAFDFDSSGEPVTLQGLLLTQLREFLAK